MQPEAEATTQVETPTQQYEKALLAQYEFEDHAFDPPEPKTPPAERPRDDKGRFLKPAETPAAAAPIVTPPTPPKHSPRLVRMATEIGIPEGEISEMSGEALESAIHQAQRYLLEERRGTTGSRATPNAVVPQEPREMEIDWGESEDGTKYSETDYAKPIAKAVKAGHRLEQLEKRVEAMEQFQRANQQRGFMSRLDKLFTAQKEVFGDGPTNTLDPEGPEAARRRAVMAHLNMLVQSKKHSTPEKDFATASKLLFGAAKPTPPAAEPTPKNGHNPRITPEDWEEAPIAAPTHREQAELPLGLERARRKFAKDMREKGLADDDGSQSEETLELPG